MARGERVGQDHDIARDRGNLDQSPGNIGALVQEIDDQHGVGGFDKDDKVLPARVNRRSSRRSSANIARQD